METNDDDDFLPTASTAAGRLNQAIRRARLSLAGIPLLAWPMNWGHGFHFLDPSQLKVYNAGVAHCGRWYHVHLLVLL